MRVQDSFSDRFCHKLKTVEEEINEYPHCTNDWIIENFLDYSIEVPDDLVARHKEACKKFWEVDNELHKYLKENKLI